MHKRNRVDPWGELNAVAEKGTLMGNRGILHDAQERIVRPWGHKHWVSCVLQFDRVKPRPVFEQGRYSQLFFLDEATAFAAGHRPCNYCQRARSQAFKAAWLEANVPAAERGAFSMEAIDVRLHQERALRGGAKVVFDAPLASLPLGTMFVHEGRTYLVAEGRCLPWSFGGYGAPVALPPESSVFVLTPRSIVAAFRAGFSPDLHPSRRS